MRGLFYFGLFLVASGFERLWFEREAAKTQGDFDESLASYKRGREAALRDLEKKTEGGK